jgi:hypothetical protein
MVPPMREIIHVLLLDEGVDAWRPVDAVRVGAESYRITSDMAAAEYEEEKWEFVTGDIVRCTKRVRANGEEVMIAVEKIG